MESEIRFKSVDNNEFTVWAGMHYAGRLILTECGYYWAMDNIALSFNQIEIVSNKIRDLNNERSKTLGN